MTTTHELTLDLQKKGELQRIDVVQGDAGTRLVELTLVSNGYPWEVPVHATPAVRYLKPDGSSGVYDHLPDGGSGFRFNGNVLTMELAPQLLTCAGAVQVQVELSYQEQRIATFAFLIVVEQAVAMDGETGDYVNWTKLHLPQVTDAEQGQFLQVAQVDEAGRVVELAPVDDPAAEVKAQIPVLENHILAVGQRVEDASVEANQRLDVLEMHLDAVGQRVEDASVDAADAIRLASNAVARPDTAQVGQILAVKSLGGNGRAMECEAIDLPAGGSGGVTWETIIDYTVPEDCAQVLLKTDLNGNPFKLKEAIVTFLLLPIADVTSAIPVRYTVDGSITNTVYSVEHYAHGAPTTPTAAGKCTVFKIHVIDTPFGVHLIEATQAKDANYSQNAQLGVRPVDVFDPFNSSTLMQKVAEISGAGVGGVGAAIGAAIGAGSRIIMVGVRE